MYGSATSDRIVGENEAADRVARASSRFYPVRPWGTSSSSPTPADHGQPCRRGPSREVAGHEGRTASARPALAVLAPPATEAACRRLRRLGAPGLRPPLQPQELLRRPGRPAA